MKVISATVLALLAALPAVQAHMEMTSPRPIFRIPGGNIAPIVSSAQSGTIPNFCNGQLDAKFGAGPVTEWAAGSQQEFVIGGGAAHGGGSCQASFSEDGGLTWKAVKTFYGNCPGLESPSSFKFTVPAEIKAGPAIFAWTWFNKVGNREMYMNCAKINITGAGGSGLSEYSDMFIGNTASECAFPEDGTNPDIPVNGKGEIEPATKPTNLGAVKDISTCFPAGKHPDDKYVPVAGGGPAPPAGGDDKPPVEDVKPPVEDVKPPVEDVKPPVEDVKPPVEDVKPPVEDVKPPVEDVKPPVEDVKPPVEDVKPNPDTEPINLNPIVKPGTGGSCTDGEIGCPTETTWTLCANGTPIPMGNVAPGTKCTGNTITKRRAAVRFSGAHVARRRVL